VKKHPLEADLALFAGEDLTLGRSILVRLHLAGCSRCRHSVEAYQHARVELARLPEPLTGEEWTRLAAEMEANINLGLEASECIQQVADEEPEEAGTWRPFFACAAALVVVAGLVWWNRPPAEDVLSHSAVVMSAGPDSIELQQDGQALGLLHRGAENVTYSVRADGEVGVRYFDNDTGYVMIQNVVASD
jgi:hypothetical protein